MNKIKILSDRIIIDGHADTREQCETATMLANLLLAQGSGFNCVEYRSGYAEFKKSDVVKLADSELKFAPAIAWVTMIFDSHISAVNCRPMAVNWTSSGETQKTVAYDGTTYTFDVVLSNGYVIDTVALSSSDESQGKLTEKTDTTFSILAGAGGINQTITLTSKSAAFDGKINITKSAGVVLKTQGKYCDKDITVVPTLEEKSVTPTESAQEITPSDGKCGISKVNVGAVQTETKTITPTTSQQTFTPTSGKYFKQVICQAIQAYQGTATPSQSEQIFNPTSGKYFSSFKVAAIPSDYVKPSGTLQITDNGTKDVTNYKNVNVNVPTASAVEEVATASAMDALLVEANVGKYYKFTGTTDSNYTNGDLYLVEVGAVSSGYTVSYILSGGMGGALIPMFVYNGKKYGYNSTKYPNGDNKFYKDDEIVSPEAYDGSYAIIGELNIPSVPTTITWGYNDSLQYANKTGDITITNGTSGKLDGAIIVNGNGSFEIKGTD